MTYPHPPRGALANASVPRPYRVHFLVITLIALSLLGLFIGFSYKQSTESIELASSSEAAILANQWRAALRRIDAVSVFIRDNAAADTADADTPTIIDAHLEGHFASLGHRFPEVIGLFVFDANGALIVGGDGGAVPLSIADRNYFLRTKAAPVDGLFFSETLVNKFSHELSLIAYRPILAADGSLRALVVIPVNVPYYQDLFSRVAVGNEGVVSVRRSDDSRLVMHWPHVEHALNSAAKDNPPFRLIEAGSTSDVVRHADSIDDIERIFAFHQIADFPFFVLVGRSVTEQLAPFRRLVVVASALTLGTLILILLILRWLQSSNYRLQQSERQFNSMVDSRQDAVCRWRPDTTLTFCNAKYAELFDADASELIGRRWIELIPASERDALQTRIAGLWAAPDVHTWDQELAHADGRRVWIRWLDAPLTDEHGQCVEFQSIGHDISAQKQAELRLRQLAQAVEQSPECIVITDTNARIEYVNEAFSRSTGYTCEEAIGKNPRILNAGDTPAAVYDDLWATLLRGEVWRGEFHNTRKDGTSYLELATIAPIKQADGTITHYVAVKEDITARRQNEELIHRLAFFDPLTQLPNRALLQDRLTQAILSSERGNEHGMLLLLDLDHFKLLNETQGHQIGDTLLQEIADRLRRIVREEDTVARLGDDDFAVIIENLGDTEAHAINQAEVIATNIRRALNTPYDLAIPGGYYHSTQSIGITLFKGRSVREENLFNQAEVALYKAKSDGRNAIRFFSPAMQSLVDAHATLERGLRGALATNAFQLFYQPQVDQHGHVFGAEALIRWFDAHGKMISPAEFIPLAEETGLIVPIGYWVIETACAQLNIWQAQPSTRDLVLAVNVSAKQFHQPDFVDQVRIRVERSGIDPTRLKLELTESVILGDIEDTIARMNEIRALGVRFSLDDFGTGYSSLSYLKRLPFDQIKIDQSFVRDMMNDHSSGTIVRAILAMSASLGLEVVAEGVETLPQRDFLHSSGCKFYQGYLFSKPLPIAAWGNLALTGASPERTPAV